MQFLKFNLSNSANQTHRHWRAPITREITFDSARPLTTDRRSIITATAMHVKMSESDFRSRNSVSKVGHAKVSSASLPPKHRWSSVTPSIDSAINQRQRSTMPKAGKFQFKLGTFAKQILSVPNLHREHENAQYRAHECATVRNVNST